MDSLVLLIVIVGVLVVAAWALAIAVSGGMLVGVWLVRGYLGGTMFRLIGLSLLTLAFLPLGLCAALLIGWFETRELNDLAEAQARRHQAHP